MLDPEGIRARARVLSAVRRWFEDHGYLEVPTPALVFSPAIEEHLYAIPAGLGVLRTSPEFALKRVIASGLPRIYEIAPCFRDRESGPWHGCEFLMLEWYRVGAQLTDLMDEVEAITAAAAAALGRAAPGPWRRVSVRTLFHEVTGLDLANTTATQLSPKDADDWDTAFFRCWVNEVEPALTGPTFVHSWPASQAALSQIRTDGPWPVAERFEAFLSGVELANAFHELIDPVEQRRRAHATNAARVAHGEAPHPLDERFMQAVGQMPPTSGIALGLERLVAALCGWSGIDPSRVD